MSDCACRTRRYRELPPQREALAVEHEILSWWDRHDIFKRSMDERPETDNFVFYEGPPTANGRPGVHHAMSRTIKDLVCRYQTMQGRRVLRKAGWDTHGLPVEIEVENSLGLDGKDQIEQYGIARFNQACRESVFRYLDEWHDFTRRLGFWLDLDRPYVTCSNEYIESVWWILKQFWDRDMLFEGHKIVPYCARCGTSLSSHEVSQGYRDVSDPSIFVRFRLKDENAFFLVWTTTPWTLISNVALAVGPEHDYVRVRHQGQELILAEALLHVLEGEYEIVAALKGRDLVGSRYRPCFPFFEHEQNAFRVIGADFVTLADGTGIVHIAPAFGEDDYVAGTREGLPFLQPVDARGCFTPEVAQWAGRFIKEADAEIIADLDERGLLYRAVRISHSYPFCWRCDSPLIYYARRSWYIRTTAFKDLLLEANAKVGWYPPEVGENRFTRWLEGNVDWALSRERYWGTPLNIWTCDSCGEKFCIGNLEELRSISEQFPEPFDLHKPFIDELDVGCPECGGKMTRVPEVIDCWFDSGAMPFAQYHYPMENMELFRAQYPAEFISEGVDQSRGWFYSLLVIGAFLTGESPYRRVLPHGMVLDREGQKMSKSRGNAVFAADVLHSDGADALRWYLMTSGAPYLPKRFDLEAMRDGANRFLGTLRNLYGFFALYAEIDAFEPGAPAGEPGLLDRWILSRYNSTAREVATALDSYELTRAARALQDFVIDELSNWYLRRSRRRFWKNEMSGDKLAAYQTFHAVLEGVTRLAAPFAPFLADAVWLRLRGAEATAGLGASVHLERFPAPDAARIDERLERRMAGVLAVVTLGRAVRNANGIKVRTPLAEMFVHGRDAGSSDWCEDDLLRGLVLDELNVKKITLVDSLAGLVSLSVKPDYAKLGKRFGARMKAVAAALEALGPGRAADLALAGEIAVEVEGSGETIALDDVRVARETAAGYGSETDGDLTVILDARLTPELRREGAARDLVNRIQNLRKESGFEVSDRIELSWRASNGLAGVIEQYSDHICSETLVETLLEGEQDWEHSTAFELDGIHVELWVRKA